MKKLILLSLLPLFCVSAFAQKHKLIYNGRLDSNLDGAGFSITNATFSGNGAAMTNVAATNLVGQFNTNVTAAYPIFTNSIANQKYVTDSTTSATAFATNAANLLGTTTTSLNVATPLNSGNPTTKGYVDAALAASTLTNGLPNFMVQSYTNGYQLNDFDGFTNWFGIISNLNSLGGSISGYCEITENTSGDIQSIFFPYSISPNNTYGKIGDIIYSEGNAGLSIDGVRWETDGSYSRIAIHFGGLSETITNVQVKLYGDLAGKICNVTNDLGMSFMGTNIPNGGNFFIAAADSHFSGNLTVINNSFIGGSATNYGNLYFPFNATNDGTPANGIIGFANGGSFDGLNLTVIDDATFGGDVTANNIQANGTLQANGAFNPQSVINMLDGQAINLGSGGSSIMDNSGNFTLTLGDNFSVNGGPTEFTSGVKVDGTATITNSANLLGGNGALITGIKSTNIVGTLINTNFLTGQLYTNTTGVPYEILGYQVALTNAAIAGLSSISLEVSGWTTNIICQQTTAVGILQTGAMYFSGSPCVISNTAVYRFVNNSTGAGNSATIKGGQIKY